MNNSSYFSQYESPNIVIVPKISTITPSSPKRCKVGNNIIVPIVKNTTCEKKNSNLKEPVIVPGNSNSSKIVNNNENSTPSSKTSWASNYLQSIGLDKTISIWNHKIPRKKELENCVIAMEPKKLLTAIPPSSSCIQKTSIHKNDQLKIPNKTVVDSNALKDSSPKIRQPGETRKHNVKEKQECIKPVSKKIPSGHKNSKKENNLPCKNKDMQNDLSKMNTEKNESVKLFTTSRQNLHTKIENKTKGHKSKIPSKHLKVGHKQIDQTHQEKSKIKSVVTKQNLVKENSKYNVKMNTRPNQKKSDGVKPSISYLSGGKEKEKRNKNPECPTRDVGAMKNVQETKKYDTCEVNNLCVTKKKQLKSQHVQNKTELYGKSKSEKIKDKSDLKLSTKSIKSPSKKKTSKTKNYRKIKLVVNLICNNQSNSPQCNEISSNVDLDFLNDFNIDEIVESLDTCEKISSQYNVETQRELNKCGSKGNLDRPLKSNISTNYNKNAQNDAMDLINILKGEEDDDITKISLENPKELQFSSNFDRTQSTEKSLILDYVSKCCKISENLSTMAIKVKDELGTLSETSKAYCDLSPKADFIQIKKTCNVIKDKSKKETTENGLKRKTKDFTLDDSTLPYCVKRRSNSLEKSSIDVDNDHNKISAKVEEQKVNVFSDVTDLGLGKDTSIKGNINEIKKEYDIVENNECKNFENNQIHPLSSENVCIEEKLHSLQKVLNTDNVATIADSENYSESSKKLETQIIPHIVNFTKDKYINEIAENVSDAKVDAEMQEIANSINECEQEDNVGNIIAQGKLENLNNDRQKCIDKQNDDKSDYKNDKCNTEIKEVKSCDTSSNNVNNFINEHNILQSNNNTINVPENDGDNKKLPTISNFLKEDSIISAKKLQKDNKENNYEEIFVKNKQKDVTDKETTNAQANILDNDENTRSNIKAKTDLATVLKLEQGLFTCSGSKYSIISIIHTGKFSKVFKCKHPNGKYYALKMLTADMKYNSGKEKKIMLSSLISDIPKDNLFIVHLANAFNMVDKWCFLMEYYPKNLDQALREIGKPFSIENIQDFARQLVMAVMVLKNKNMVHMDIKPKHILINSTNNILKLCGFDNLCYINKMRSLLPNVGTVNYRAPEVILGYESGFEIDVWSTGLVLYEMATNRKLFPGIYNNDILYKQMCTLGCVPYHMLRKSRFSGVHFIGSKFMRKSGFKGQNITIINKFYQNKKLCDSIYNAYYENWGHQRTISQQNCDIGKLSLFVKLLQKMLTIHPESRLPIEFVYANPFIYDAYSYQEW